MSRLKSFGVILTASVLISGCSGGETDGISPDNKEDVKALRNLGATLEVDKDGHVRKVTLPKAVSDGSGRSITSALRNDDLKHLAGLPGLNWLVLWKTSITDEGLAHLANLKSLHTLDLMQTRITDEGLRHLSGLAQLRSLDLSDTQVTDQGVERLANLDQLESLDLSRTRVTPRGVQQLAKALPKTNITCKR